MCTTIVTATDEKGRFTVPGALLKELGLEAPVKVVAWRENDKIIMETASANGAKAAWDEFFKKMDEKNITMSEEEIVEEVHAYRRERRQAALDASKAYDTTQMYFSHLGPCPDESGIASAWRYRF